MPDLKPPLGKQVLDVPMQENDAKAATVRDYLKTLLLALWKEGECFSGKRPFGNSGWEYEVYLALVKARVVAGKTGENDDLEDVDERAAGRAISAAIAALN